MILCVGKIKTTPKTTINHESCIDIQDENLEGCMSKEVSLVVSSLSYKPDPFYAYLYIAGYKLRNYIIDSGASDILMPSKVTHDLGIYLKKIIWKSLFHGGKTSPTCWLV